MLSSTQVTTDMHVATHHTDIVTASGVRADNANNVRLPNPGHCEANRATKLIIFHTARCYPVLRFTLSSRVCVATTSRSHVRFFLGSFPWNWSLCVKLSSERSSLGMELQHEYMRPTAGASTPISIRCTRPGLEMPCVQ